MDTDNLLVFSGNANRPLAQAVCRELGTRMGKALVSRFSDGEVQVEIEENVRRKEVFVIQPTSAPTAENFMELLVLIDALNRASATNVTAVVPYFGYARQDRKDKPRVPISAKLVANLLVASGINRIITLDLHAPQVQGFFDIPVDHLDSSAVFIPYIKELELENLLIASPDVGSVKRARFYAKHLLCDMVICDKYRKKANEIAEMTLIGDVKGRDVVLIDDIVDTAGTLVNAAQIIMDRGANSVRAMCTHPVLSGKAYERVQESCLSELVVCNTIPLTQNVEKIKELSVSQLFATAIKRIFEHRSISSLFV